jgi:hypothetical protein
MKNNMKKTLLISAFSLVLALSATGCGCKKTSGGKSGSGDAYTQDVENNYTQNVDMNKVQGESGSSDTDESESKGKIGNAEVSVDDAKLIDYEGDKVAIVSFTFKNNGEQPASFMGLLKVYASQNDSDLLSAVVSDIDGVNVLSADQYVEKGESITVQRAYKLKDEKTALVIDVTSVVPSENAVIVGKVFTFGN